MQRLIATGALALLAGSAGAEGGPAGGTVAVNGLEMYHEASGEGDPLIVLHGSFMTIPMMGEIVPRLAETHRVHAVELQGHGRMTDADRPITYPGLADDVAAFMDAVGIEKADVFGYSMGAGVGLQLAIRHPGKVGRLVLASTPFDGSGRQPAFEAALPRWSPEMFMGTPFEAAYRGLAPNPEGFRALAEKLIALERGPIASAEEVQGIEAPVLLIVGDADGLTLEHAVAFFRLLGGGAMGDMGEPLPAARLAVLPATAHTAVITQADLLHAVIEPFLLGETPAGFMGEAPSPEAE